MNIKWLLQDIGKTTMLEDNFNTVRSIHSNYSGFGLIEGKTHIINLENILTDVNDIYIIRGGTKVVFLLENYSNLEDICQNLNSYQLENKDLFFKKLKDGMFYNGTYFDQFYYNKLDLPLLNKDSFFLPIKDNKNTYFDVPYFLKPSKDLKTFLPGILLPGQTISQFIETSQHLKNYDHELALLSSVKTINKEYRFFVIDKKIITGSQYKNGAVIEYNQFIPNPILSIAHEYAQLYQPHDIFTMDLADTPNGVKIVEYNCWNGSGLYHCDKISLFKSVEKFISIKYNLKNTKLYY